MDFSKKQIEFPRRNVEPEDVAKTERKQPLRNASKPKEPLKNRAAYDDKEDALDPIRQKILTFMMVFLSFGAVCFLLGNIPFLWENLSSNHWEDVKFALLAIAMSLSIIGLSVFLLRYGHENQKRDSIENFKRSGKIVNFMDLLKEPDTELKSFEDVKEEISNMTPHQLRQLNFIVNFFICFVSLLMLVSDRFLGIASFVFLIFMKRKLKEQIMDK